MLLGCAYASEEAASTGSVPASSEPLNTSGSLSLSDLKEIQIYENAQYGFEISYLANWTAQEPDPNDEGIIVGFLAPGENVDNPAVYLLLQNEELPAGQEVTLEQYSQAALGILQETMPDLEIQAESDVTIGEMPGHAIVYNLESEDMTFRVLKAWTVIGEDAYVFTYNAPDELYDQFAADAADMIDSFKDGTAVQQAESPGPWVGSLTVDDVKDMLPRKIALNVTVEGDDVDVLMPFQDNLFGKSSILFRTKMDAANIFRSFSKTAESIALL